MNEDLFVDAHAVLGIVVGLDEVENGRAGCVGPTGNGCLYLLVAQVLRRHDVERGLRMLGDQLAIERGVIGDEVRHHAQAGRLRAPDEIAQRGVAADFGLDPVASEGVGGAATAAPTTGLANLKNVDQQDRIGAGDRTNAGKLRVVDGLEEVLAGLEAVVGPGENYIDAGGTAPGRLVEHAELRAQIADRADKQLVEAAVCLRRRQSRAAQR